ncbi:MAG TPA: PEP-CTERM sorting domain-containing protein [Vicinamibacterales bacterium]|nr:PEP-CTERM sorting domain-containing protein [Vicinamibacterales bacterium]
MARTATLLVALLLIVPSSGFAALCEVQGNLVQNCGFESGLQSWTAFDLTGTSASSEFVNSGTTSAALATLAGSSGSISQSILTDSGQTYLVSFWFMTDIGGTFEATWNGASMFSTVAPASAPYSLFQFSVVGSGAAGILRFFATTPEPPDPGGDHTWYVDDVSVVATPTSVPEPASLTLLSAGLGAIAVTRRLRRRGFAAALMFALLLMHPSAGFAAPCDVQSNLVQNCGFESGLQSWTTLDVVGTSTASEFVNSGTTSAALATLAGSSGSISQSIPMDAAQAYLVSFWLLRLRHRCPNPRV